MTKVKKSESQWTKLPDINGNNNQAKFLVNPNHDRFRKARLQKESGDTGELQPIGHRRGLVASENYTVYKPEGQKYKVIHDSPERPSHRNMTRSQPNSSTQEPEPIYRQTSSAPTAPKENDQSPPLPKIDNLVRKNPSPSRPSQQPNLRRHAGLPTSKSMGPDDKWAATVAPRGNKPQRPAAKTSRDESSESIKERIERENTKETIYMGGQKPGQQREKSPQKSHTSPYLQHKKPMTKPSPAPSQSPSKAPTEGGDSVDESSSPIPSPRREATKAALQKMKHVLLQRAKTQDALKIQRTKSHVTKVTEQPVEKEMEDREKDLYHMETVMHIYFADYLKAKAKVSIDPETPRKKNVYNDPNRNIPPWHRKEYVLSKRETEQYTNISTIYGKETKEAKKKREENFYKKCLRLQIEAWRRMHEENAAKKRKEAATRDKQADQLDSVRGKFEDEQLKRFQTQYVTSRVLAHEWADRHLYGLPEEPGDDPQQKAKIKPKPGPRATFDSKKQNKVNGVRYRNIFWRFWEPKWNPKKPKMADGKDGGQPPQLSISEEMQGNEYDDDPDDSDAEKARKQRVRDILNDAQEMLDNDGDWEDDDGQDKENNKHVRFASPRKEPAKTTSRVSKPPGVRAARPAPRPPPAKPRSPTKPSPKPNDSLASSPYKQRRDSIKMPSSDFRNGAGKGGKDDGKDGKDGEKGDGKGDGKDNGNDGKDTTKNGLPIDKDNDKNKNGSDEDKGDTGLDKDGKGDGKDGKDKNNKGDGNDGKGDGKDNKGGPGKDGKDSTNAAGKSTTSKTDPNSEDNANSGGDKNKGKGDGKDGLGNGKDGLGDGKDGSGDGKGDDGKGGLGDGKDGSGVGTNGKDGKDGNGGDGKDGRKDGDGDGTGDGKGDGKDRNGDGKDGKGDGKDGNGDGKGDGKGGLGSKDGLSSGLPNDKDKNKNGADNDKNKKTDDNKPKPGADSTYDKFARTGPPGDRRKSLADSSKGKPPIDTKDKDKDNSGNNKGTGDSTTQKPPLKPALKRRQPSGINRNPNGSADSKTKNASKPTVRITTPPEKKPKKKKDDDDLMLYADPSKKPKRPAAVTTKITTEKEIETTTTTKKKKRIVREDSYDTDDEIGPDKKKTNNKDTTRKAPVSTVGERPNIPTPDLESDTDDDDEDIFEKARRKYGIVLDSDDDN